MTTFSMQFKVFLVIALILGSVLPGRGSGNPGAGQNGGAPASSAPLRPQSAPTGSGAQTTSGGQAPFSIVRSHDRMLGSMWAGCQGSFNCSSLTCTRAVATRTASTWAVASCDNLVPPGGNTNRNGAEEVTANE